MKIWIDLENSPHVLFFRPIVRRLEQAGHEVFLTARDMAQTRELADLYGLSYTLAGRFHGKNFVTKALSVVVRAFRLFRLGARYAPDVAVAHGSRAMTIAAYTAGIPVINAIDYEYGALGVFNLFSRRFLFPDCIPAERLYARGVGKNQLGRYPGFKEYVYLDAPLDPDPETARSLELAADDIVVVLRPPATRAHYHSMQTEKIFERLLTWLERGPANLAVLISPRYDEQREALTRRFASDRRFRVLKKALGGEKLLAVADLVISGGGTMVREAAVLGIPSYSIFDSRPGKVDETLVAQGRMAKLAGPDDVDKIALKKRDRAAAPDERERMRERSHATVQFFLDEIAACARRV